MSPGLIKTCFQSGPIYSESACTVSAFSMELRSDCECHRRWRWRASYQKGAVFGVRRYAFGHHAFDFFCHSASLPKESNFLWWKWSAIEILESKALSTNRVENANLHLDIERKQRDIRACRIGLGLGRHLAKVRLVRLEYSRGGFLGRFWGTPEVELPARKALGVTAQPRDQKRG